VVEEISEESKVGWRHMEHLRHANFILLEAVQTGEMLLQRSGWLFLIRSLLDRLGAPLTPAIRFYYGLHLGPMMVTDSACNLTGYGRATGGRSDLDQIHSEYPTLCLVLKVRFRRRQKYAPAVTFFLFNASCLHLVPTQLDRWSFQQGLSLGNRPQNLDMIASNRQISVQRSVE
jgi:hypothetical protein